MSEEKKQNEKALSLILSLAEELGVDLKDERTAIATEGATAKVKMYDNSLETTIFERSNGAAAHIKAPRAPSILIELVNPMEDEFSPDGAVYKITAYKPKKDKVHEALNGDVFSVYIGKKGIMLNDAAKLRIARKYKE